MNNTTSSVETTTKNNNNSTIEFSTKDFVFQFINLVFSLYILVALMVYHIKIESKKIKSKENIVLNFVCYLNAFCAFLCVLKDLPMLYMRSKTQLFCLLLVDIAGGAPYFLGISSAFCMLWYRQRKLYSSPVMKVYVFKGFKPLNRLLVVCFFLLMVAITAVFLYESTWELQDNKMCKPAFSDKFSMTAITACYCVLTVICQVTLFLFISYPIVCSLVKKERQMNPGLKKMLKRLLLCTVGCCIGNLQINLFVLLVEKKHIYLYWPNFAGLDVIITAVCVIGTFGNWHERLFPFCSKETEKRPKFIVIDSMNMIRCKTYEPSTNKNKDNFRRCKTMG